MMSAAEPVARSFDFERDTFAFRNELVWEYRFEGDTNATVMVRNDPPPQYAHRCFVLTRSARQFRYHARFDPALPVAEEQVYRRLAREVVARSPRVPSGHSNKIVIPGYDSLRSFSKDRESLLKSTCGGAWQSYVVRSHWRMVFPVSRPHQRDVAAGLLNALAMGRTPIVHLFRFPQLTINHAILLFDARESTAGVRFAVYDPNIPSHPTELTYERADGWFHLPRNHYWAGGKLNVVEAYRNWLY